MSSGPISLDSGVPRIAVRGGHRNDGLTKTNLGECFAAVQPLAARTSLIAVLFADQQPDIALLPLIANAGFAGVMLDTANKSGGGLMSHVSCAFLTRFVSRAREFELIAGLAGSLAIEDLPRLVESSPDYLGFRGALCETARATAIRRDKVIQVANAMITARAWSSEITDSMQQA